MKWVLLINLCQQHFLLFFSFLWAVSNICEWIEYKKTEAQLFHKQENALQSRNVRGGARGEGCAGQGCWLGPTWWQRLQISSGTQPQPVRISRSDPRSLWCPTPGGCWISRRTRSHLSAPWPCENKEMFQQLNGSSSYSWALHRVLSAPRKCHHSPRVQQQGKERRAED